MPKNKKENLKLSIAKAIGKLQVGQMTINGEEGRATEDYGYGRGSS